MLKTGEGEGRGGAALIRRTKIVATVGHFVRALQKVSRASDDGENSRVGRAEALRHDEVLVAARGCEKFKTEASRFGACC